MFPDALTVSKTTTAKRRLEFELLHTANEVLRSRKEIANYVGAFVKTIQRWEQHYNFPIRRWKRNKGAAVFALKADVD